MDRPYLTMDDGNGFLEFLTAPELAGYLGIGKNSAYDLLREGIIKSFCIGSVWKIGEKSMRV